jgi:hypothetical protein
MTAKCKNERGIALMVSLIGIVVVGALVSGVFASGIVEQRIGENTRWMERSFAAAEYGLSETIAQWNTGVFNQLPVGGSADVAGSSPRGTGLYAGTVRRLNQELFLVEVTGRDAGGRGRQRLGGFVRLRPLMIDVQAALTTRGEPRVGGAAEIDATDHSPWSDCPPPGPGAAGIRLPAVDRVRFQGRCAGGSCVTGTPRVLNDVTVGDSTFFNYGDFTWAQLVTMATKVLTPGTYTGVNPTVTNGECQLGDAGNWGAPLDEQSPCYNYFPIIHVPGSIAINGNAGQGLLLIDGDLRVQGNFQFFGIAIVRGTLRTAGSGNHFNGGVLAANQSGDQTTILGNAQLNYSSCAVGRALQAGSPGAMLRSRGWVQAY